MILTGSCADEKPDEVGADESRGAGDEEGLHLMPFNWPKLETRQFKMFVETEDGCETPLPHEHHGYGIDKTQVLIRELLHQLKRLQFLIWATSEYLDF